MLEPGELITARRPSPPALRGTRRYRKVRDRRVVRVRRRLRRRPVRRAPRPAHRLRRPRPRPVARRRAEAALADTARRRGGGARPSSRRPSRCATTPSRSRSPATSSCRRSGVTASPTGALGAPPAGGGRRQGPRRRRTTPTSATRTALVLRRGSSVDRRARGDHARRRRAARHRSPSSATQRGPLARALDDGELHVLQSPARPLPRRRSSPSSSPRRSRPPAPAPSALAVDYDAEPHDVVLRADHPRPLRPGRRQRRLRDGLRDRRRGGRARPRAASRSTAPTPLPPLHNNAMEPHASVASGGRATSLVVHDATQGVFGASATRWPRSSASSPSRSASSPSTSAAASAPRAPPRPHIVARRAGRPARSGARSSSPLTRQQMFAVTGYRTPTIQRVRLGADADGPILAIAHDALSQTSRREGVHGADRDRHPRDVRRRATAARPTALARLDVPTPSWMRAPGECPGMFALESAMDELAAAARPGPDRAAGPQRTARAPRDRQAVELAQPASRACATGAERFGWAGRDPAPRQRRTATLVGTGVAAAMYPVYRAPAWASANRRGRRDVHRPDRRRGHRHGRAHRRSPRSPRTRSEPPPSASRVELGDSDLPRAGVAGGSMGTASLGLGRPRRLPPAASTTDGAEGRVRHPRGPRGARGLRPPRLRRASSPRSGWTPSPGEIAGGAAAGRRSRPDASSTRRPRARSSSAA